MLSRDNEQSHVDPGLDCVLPHDAGVRSYINPGPLRLRSVLVVRDPSINSESFSLLPLEAHRECLASLNWEFLTMFLHLLQRPIPHDI